VTERLMIGRKFAIRKLNPQPTSNPAPVEDERHRCGRSQPKARHTQRPTKKPISYDSPKVSLTLVKAPGKVTLEIQRPRTELPGASMPVITMARPTCLDAIIRIADPVPRTEQDVLDDLLASAQRLAIDVLEYPPDKRDEVMQRIGGLIADVASEASCTHEMALEFGAALEQVIRDYVAEIEMSGGGTVGTA
jgi:hypothetical protein